MGTPGHKLIQFPERKPGPGLMQEEESQFSNLVLWLITELSESLQRSSAVPPMYSVVMASSHVLCHTCATATNN